MPSLRHTAPFIIIGVLAVAATAFATEKPETASQPTKLAVVWTSGDPDVALKVCLMNTHGAKKFGWFEEVRLVVWGPSQRLLAGDPAIQEKIQQMQADGVVVEACVACAKGYGLVERIRELGLEVKPMGQPLTDFLKSPEYAVLTF